MCYVGEMILDDYKKVRLAYCSQGSAPDVSSVFTLQLTYIAKNETECNESASPHRSLESLQGKKRNDLLVSGDQALHTYCRIQACC